APKDGWFRPEQSASGEEHYLQHCVRCHGVTLEGVIGQTPPLTGPQFRSRWRYLTLNRLFQYTRSMMPLDAPASLQDETYVQILAYMLDVNGFPSGDDPLRSDRLQLGQRYLPPLEGLPGGGLPEEETGVEPEAR